MSGGVPVGPVAAAARRAVARLRGLDRDVVRASARRARADGSFEWPYARMGPCPIEAHAPDLLALGAVEVVGEEALGQLSVRRYRFAPWMDPEALAVGGLTSCTRCLPDPSHSKERVDAFKVV